MGFNLVVQQRRCSCDPSVYLAINLLVFVLKRIIFISQNNHLHF